MASNRPIPALYQGVSQQPAAQRSLEQVAALENGYVTVADGNRKRPPTQHVKKLTAGTPGAAKVHQYFRGDGEHNIILSDHDSVSGLGVLLAFDGVTGTQKVVDTTTFSGSLSYIDSTNAMDDLGMLTVADTTFIWNRTKTVATVAASITAQLPRLFIYVKEAVQAQDYSVWVGTAGGVTAAFNSGTGPPSTVAIAVGLKAAILALPDGGTFTVTQDGSLLTIWKTDNSDFQFNMTDSAGDSMMSAFKNRVERYSDLPRHFTEGVVIAVQGEADVTGKTAFWVTFKRDTSHSTGYWEETVAPNVGEATALDPTTMPHALVRLSDGSFQLQRVAWNARLVGSTATSAPLPSFVGGKINSLFFYRNRLGVLSGENTVLSRANSLYNFWPKSGSAVLDDDPIDITANSPKVSILHHAVPFQRTLVLFSDNGQFILTGSDILTPKTVRLDQATEFDASAIVSPVSSGQDLFFCFERASSGASYSGVREYFINPYVFTNDAVDVTSHIPQYIPQHVFHASVSSTEDVLLLCTKAEWNRVYFYKYLWDGDKRVQSAWGRWTFRPSDKVLAADLDKTTVNLVIQRVDGVYLERMNMQATATTDTLPFAIQLDSLAQDDRSVITTPVYLADVDQTVVQKPYTVPSGEGTVVVVAGDGHASGNGQVLSVVGTFGLNGLKLRGKWDDGKVYFGVQYAHRTTISEQFMRDANGTAIQQGRLQLKYLTMNFRNAVSFRAEVATPGRDVAVYNYSALQLGIIGSTIGSIVLRSGSWTFPIASKSTLATITLVNDSPYPATFYSGEWEGEFTTRSQRR